MRKREKRQMRRDSRKEREEMQKKRERERKRKEKKKDGEKREGSTGGSVKLVGVRGLRCCPLFDILF